MRIVVYPARFICSRSNFKNPVERAPQSQCLTNLHTAGRYETLRASLLGQLHYFSHTNHFVTSGDLSCKSSSFFWFTKKRRCWKATIQEKSLWVWFSYILSDFRNLEFALNPFKLSPGRFNGLFIYNSRHSSAIGLVIVGILHPIPLLRHIQRCASRR